MHFEADKRGARLTAAQFFVIGLLPCLICLYFFIIIGAVLVFIWAALCAVLYFRLCRLNVTVEKNVLRVEKGKWFPLVLRVPITYITGVHILQTPLSKKLGVCFAVIYTSGLTFLLLGIQYENAAALAALASRGGST